MKLMSSSIKYDALEPNMEKVLALIHAKRPLLEFMVVDNSSARINSEEYKTYATKVAVWQHGQKLGSIHSRFSKYSKTKQQTEYWIAVECPYIEVERGRRGTKFTKSPEVAAKIVVDVFAKAPLSVLGEKLTQVTGDRVNSAHSTLWQAVHYSSKFSDVDMREYFIEQHLGNNPQVPTKITAVITDKVVAEYKAYKIAQVIRDYALKGNGFAVQYCNDDTYLVTDMANNEYTYKYKTTYEMPQFMQEKLAILKILKVDEFAENIGVKVTSNLEEIFFIVKGDTIAH